MSTVIDEEILKDFISETQDLVDQMKEMIEEAEEKPDGQQLIENYGLLVDRIMGGSKSLALGLEPEHPIHKIADYSAVCKAVAYKTAQIDGKSDFYQLCVALLIDATEVLGEILDSLKQSQKVDIKEIVSQTLIDRVKWVSSKFSDDIRGSVAISKDSKGKLSQDEIDKLLQKLGF